MNVLTHQLCRRLSENLALAADDPEWRCKDQISGAATRVTSAMTLLHVRHDLLAEEQLPHGLLCPALSCDVIGHGDEIATSALER